MAENQLFHDLQPITLGGVISSTPLVISGPCSAETERQVLDTAHALAKIGIKIFRAGIWKPRTKPGCFEGVGAKGLLWLKKVKEETGMFTATEVANREHVKVCLDAGVDMLWLGARTSANPFAVQDIADALMEHKEDVTVLIKNPVNPDIELWIGALQRIYNAGIRHLGAIHRGFCFDGKHLYRNIPQWHIPIELHRRCPTLPMICDPSHIGGKREFIAPLAQQSLDMGFRGLIIESHCNPECALSDAQQQVTPHALDLILKSLIIRENKQHTELLSMMRQDIDQCDTEIIELLNKRMELSRKIGRLKIEHNMQVVQTSRYDEILSNSMKQAIELGMNPLFMKKVMETIHEESVRQQLEVFKNKN